MLYWQLAPKEHISMKYFLKFKSFIQENAFENIVDEMVAILSCPQCVNGYGLDRDHCGEMGELLKQRCNICNQWNYNTVLL